MMWLVRMALKRPYTFVVMSMLIVILGVVTISRMPTDIFPDNDIEHIESQSLSGVSVIKIFFQPGAKIEAATAQVTAISQTAVRAMPQGTTPPFIIRYSASNVPILQ